MSGPTKDWSDFESFVKIYIPKQTIPTLKRFGEILESYTGNDLGIRSGDKKANIMAKVEFGFRDLRASGNLDTYRHVRQNCESLGGAHSGRMSYEPPRTSVPTFGGVPRASTSSSSFTGHSAAALPSAPGYRGPSNQYASSSTTRTNGSGWDTANGAANIYQQRGTGPNHALMDWKPNPMWKPIRALTPMEMLPDIDQYQKNHTRKEKRVSFPLPADVLEKLRASKASTTPPHYSLRLFCTSGDHYKPPNAPYSASMAHIRNTAIPIEYPSNPDISVDYQGIPFRQRGLRGKPGSAPPFDLGSGPNGLNLNPSRMTSIVMGHTGPTQKKKEDWKRFWFQIVLAETHTKDELLSRLIKLTPTPAEQSIAEAKKRLDGDDIELGTSTMKLKDPLSYMRITRPVRSSQCSHIQCFDATWWIESNVQHPMWLCPLCNKELKFEDLIVDGYFFNILNAVPEDVEDVVVEPDFEWHTEDGKFGSAKWMSEHASNGPPAVDDTRKTPETNGVTDRGDIKPDIPALSPDTPPTPDRKGKRKAIEILSSDEEDDVPLSRPQPASNGVNGANGINGHRPTSTFRPPSLAPNGPPRPIATRPIPPPAPSGPGAVIDLTADSSDEEDDADNFPGPSGAATTTNGASSVASSSSSSHFHLPGVGSTHHAVTASNRLSQLPRLNERPRPNPITSTTTTTAAATTHDSMTVSRSNSGSVSGSSTLFVDEGASSGPGGRGEKRETIDTGVRRYSPGNGDRAATSYSRGDHDFGAPANIGGNGFLASPATSSAFGSRPSYGSLSSIPPPSQPRRDTLPSSNYTSPPGSGSSPPRQQPLGSPIPRDDYGYTRPSSAKSSWERGDPLLASSPPLRRVASEYLSPNPSITSIPTPAPTSPLPPPEPPQLSPRPNLNLADRIGDRMVYPRDRDHLYSPPDSSTYSRPDSSSSSSRPAAFSSYAHSPNHSTFPTHSPPQPPRPSADTAAAAGTTTSGLIHHSSYRPPPIRLPPEDYLRPGGNGTALTGGGHWSPGESTQAPYAARATTGPASGPGTGGTLTGYDTSSWSSAARDPRDPRYGDRERERDRDRERDRGDSTTRYGYNPAFKKQRASASDWMDDDFYDYLD